MKTIFLILILKLFLFAENVLLPEATVAVVNGVAISDDDIDRQVAKLMPKSYFHSTVTEDKIKELKAKALETLIEETLLYSYAQSINITIDDDEIEDILEKLEDAYGSERKMLEGMKNANFTINEFKRTVKKTLTLEKFQKDVLDVNLTDEYLLDYYEKNKFKFKEPEKIKVSLIYVKNDPTEKDGYKVAKEKIIEAEKKLKEGVEFAIVAQDYSNAMSRVKGGDMGYLHKGRLEPAVEEVAFSMDVNTTSEVIEKDIGFFIVRVEDKLKQNQLPFDKIKDKLRIELEAKEEKNKKTKLLEKLTSTAVIVK